MSGILRTAALGLAVAAAALMFAPEAEARGFRVGTSSYSFGPVYTSQYGYTTPGYGTYYRAPGYSYYSYSRPYTSYYAPSRSYYTTTPYGRSYYSVPSTSTWVTPGFSAPGVYFSIR